MRFDHRLIQNAGLLDSQEAGVLIFAYNYYVTRGLLLGLRGVEKGC